MGGESLIPTISVCVCLCVYSADAAVSVCLSGSFFCPSYVNGFDDDDDDDNDGGDGFAVAFLRRELKLLRRTSPNCCAFFGKGVACRDARLAFE